MERRREKRVRKGDDDGKAKCHRGDVRERRVEEGKFEDHVDVDRA